MDILRPSYPINNWQSLYHFSSSSCWHNLSVVVNMFHSNISLRYYSATLIKLCILSTLGQGAVVIWEMLLICNLSWFLIPMAPWPGVAYETNLSDETKKGKYNKENINWVDISPNHWLQRDSWSQRFGEISTQNIFFLFSFIRYLVLLVLPNNNVGDLWLKHVNNN